MGPEERARIIARLRQLGGAARIADLGTTSRGLRSLVEEGCVLRPDRGCVSVPGARRELEIAARYDGVVSCVSVLRLQGVMTPGDPEEVHISVPRHRGSARELEPGVIRHREDVERVPGGQRLASFRAAVSRAAQCLPYDEGVAAVDQALRRVDPARRPGLLDDVLAMVARTSPLHARALEIDVDPRARALRETEVRLVLRRAGLGVLPGAHVPGVGEVDLLVEGVLITEIDGYAYHRERPEFRRDRTRDRNALDLGFASKRFAWEDSDPLDVLVSARRTLDSLDLPLPFAAGVPAEHRQLVEALRERARDPRHRAVGARLLRGRAREGVVWPS